MGGTNCAFGIAKTCKFPGRALRLLRVLTDDTVAREWCKVGRIPALKVDKGTLATLPAPTQAALGLLNRARTSQQYYDVYLDPRLAEEHKKTTQGLFARSLTPGEAADRMEKCAREATK